MKKSIKFLSISLVLMALAFFGEGAKAQKDNTYKTVKIGEQEWMSENLNVSKFRNGDPIPEARTEEEWLTAEKERKPAWCNYDNDPAIGKKYGKLYNWYAVNDPRGLAPEGWHIPSNHEWTELEMALGMSQTDVENDKEWRGTDEGNKLKAKHGWEGKGNGTNSSGFSALPAGFRSDWGSFISLGSRTSFWTSTAFNSPVSGLYYHRMLSSAKSGTAIGCLYMHIGLSVRCLKGPAVFTLPVVTTSDPYSITNTTAIIWGYVIEDGGAAITEKGIYYSISTNPKITGTRLILPDNSSDGTITLSGLSPNTTYYVKAFAVNTEGESLGEEISFTTDVADCIPDDIFTDASELDNTKIGTFTDSRDDTEYYWVKIGKQIWMAENLNASFFRNGDTIAEARTNEEWTEGTYTYETNPFWCYYNNDKANAEKYGKLYNWYAVDNERGLCPEGWHIPSDNEWKELEMVLGMSQNDTDIEDDWRGTEEGSKLKAKCGWKSKGFGSNSSGFSALPGGRREKGGEFYKTIGLKAYFWSSTYELYNYVIYRQLNSNHSTVFRDHGDNDNGFSVRCIKN